MAQDMIKTLAERLKELGIKYEQHGDVFSVFNENDTLPYATFLVASKAERISLLAAFPFEVKAAHLQEVILAVGLLNNVIAPGRFYVDVNATDNAVFYDQYFVGGGSDVSREDIEILLQNNARVMRACARFSEVGEGTLGAAEFVKEAKNSYGNG